MKRVEFGAGWYIISLSLKGSDSKGVTLGTLTKRCCQQSSLCRPRGLEYTIGVTHFPFTPILVTEISHSRYPSTDSPLLLSFELITFPFPILRAN